MMPFFFKLISNSITKIIRVVKILLIELVLDRARIQEFRITFVIFFKLSLGVFEIDFKLNLRIFTNLIL